MAKINVAILGVEKWEQDYLIKELKKLKNIKPVFFAKPLSPAILKKIKFTNILMVFIWSQIDARAINALPNLKFISTMSTGFDHIDLKTCKEKGIKVSNVPYYGENTVAEHTFALLLALARKLPESIEKTEKGDFTLDGLRGFDLKGKTIGLVGVGSIGQHVAQFAHGFEMKILATDPKKSSVLSKKYKIQYVPLNYLLGHSDIISLHAPYNKETHHLINKSNLNKIKKGAYLINTARGGLVDTRALLVALEKNILKGVALDVLEEECFIKEEKELLTKSFAKTCNLETVLRNHLLTRHPKAIVTPHNAFNSYEALQRILDTTVDNLKGFLSKKFKNLVKQY